MDPIDKFRQEWPVIRQAPVSHAISAVVGWMIAFAVMGGLWGGMVFYYKARSERFQLEAQDSAQEALEARGEMWDERLAKERLSAELDRAKPLLDELADLKARSTVQLDHVAYLTPYIEQGNRLLVTEIENDAELSAWLKRVGAWENMVVTYLRLVSRPTAGEFDRATSQGTWTGYNQQHSREREYLSHRVDVLTSYVRLREEEVRREEREAARAQ